MTAPVPGGNGQVMTVAIDEFLHWQTMLRVNPIHRHELPSRLVIPLSEIAVRKAAMQQLQAPAFEGAGSMHIEVSRLSMSGLPANGGASGA